MANKVSSFEVPFTNTDLNQSGVFSRSAIQLGVDGEPIVQIYNADGERLEDGPYWNGSVGVKWTNGNLEVDLSAVYPISGTWKLKFDAVGIQSGYTAREINESTTALAGDLIICNTDGITITLPTVSEDGSMIKIATQAVVNPITIIASNNDAIGISPDRDQIMIIEDSYSSVELVYNLATTTWKVVTPHIPRIQQPDIVSGGYIPVEVNSAYIAKPNDFVICRKANIAITLPGEPLNGSMIKVAAQSLGPVSVISSLGDKIAGLSNLVVRRNAMIELVYNLDDKEWRVIAGSTPPTAPTISPENDVAPEESIVHRSNIQTKEGFKDWIYRKLGYPLVSVELTDEHLNDAIDDALVEFTEYAYQVRKFYAIDLKDYIEGKGVELPIGVVGVSKLNSNLVGPNAVGAGRIDSYMNDLVANGAIGFPMLGRPAGSGWVNYELALSYLEFSQRMLGGDYDPHYDVRTRILNLTPDPISARQDGGWVVCDCQCVRDDEMQFGEVWVKNMALSLAKITLGEIRGKFVGISFPGGGNLATGLKEEGISERDELRINLRERYPVASIFYY